MSLVALTRPDGSPILFNPDTILSLAEVPPSGPLAGPLKIGTRITFTNQTHQDVKELLDVVRQKIDAARTQHVQAFAAAMRTSLIPELSRAGSTATGEEVEAPGRPEPTSETSPIGPGGKATRGKGATKATTRGKP